MWLGVTNWGATWTAGYGDTDDATRLVAVRALLDGQRLVGSAGHPLPASHGAVDALVAPAGRAASPGSTAFSDSGLSVEDAEFATRFTWPLLWIFPAALAALVSAQRLGRGVVNNAAVIVCAVILASDLYLYRPVPPWADRPS